VTRRAFVARNGDLALTVLSESAVAPIARSITIVSITALQDRKSSYEPL